MTATAMSAYAEETAAAQVCLPCTVCAHAVMPVATFHHAMHMA